MPTFYRVVVYTVIAPFILSTNAFSQPNQTIAGIVKNSSTLEDLPAVSVIIKGTDKGTFTDDRGAFKFRGSYKFPITLVFSSVGFLLKEVTVRGPSDLAVTLNPVSALGEEVVVSASRISERILESPVSIERIGPAAIRNTASPNYYDLIGLLKGVDVTTSSFAFKSPSTRGFNSSGNYRFNQLVDGMDNQAPALNFSIGSLVGLTELDVESIELLPGASSALYGSGGMNGTLLINSKSPFKYQGLSIQVKQGVNHIDKYQHSAAPYYDYTLRYARKIGEQFAFKVTGQYIKAQDWQGTDQRNLLRNNVISSLKPGNRQTDPNYDGVNVFGDEASASMNALSQAFQAQTRAGILFATGGTVDIISHLNTLPATPTPAQLGAFIGNFPPVFQPAIQNLLPFYFGSRNNLFGAQFVSRTGYEEKYLVNYDAYNARFSAGLNYKITNSVEASFLGYYGIGTSVYTGADRYSLKNFGIGQYKLELKGKKWFIRGYTTQENSGDSYTATTAALYVNRAWKGDAGWFGTYTSTYSGARLQGATNEQAHTAARSAADAGRLLPGSAEFQSAFNQGININVNDGGAKFADKSALYHYEGQFNFSDYIKFAEVIAGVVYRRFSLNSNGTIFADTAGKIGINEYGSYVQMQKRFLKDVLKLTGSLRYDKNENFDGRFTPRLSALIKVAENNNIRVSFQTAYRFPATQDQYINLVIGGANRLLGGLPQFETFFQFNSNPAYSSESIVAYRQSFQTTPNPTLLKTVKFQPVKPESMQSYEVGYKGLITKNLLVDAYSYYSRYKNFNGRIAVGRGKNGAANAAADLASPFTTDNYSFVANSPTPVEAIGFGVGIEYNVYRNYTIAANGFSDRLQNTPAGLISYFNTPKYRFNIAAANPNMYKNIGFSANYRWQDKVYWEGTLGTGDVPAYGTIDAVLSYRLARLKSLVKLGGTNLFNKYYRSSFGNPEVGGLYYISIAYNVF